MALDERDTKPDLKHAVGAEASFGEAGSIQRPDFKPFGELKLDQIPQVVDLNPLELPDLKGVDQPKSTPEQILEVPAQVNSELVQEAREETLLDMLNGEVPNDKDAAWKEIEGLSQIQ